MKAEELRIGNYVYFIQEVDKIIGLSKTNPEIEKYFTNTYEEIKPIPLTEEWFNKLGFEWGYDSTGDKAFCKGFYGVDYEGYATYRDTVLDCKIIYVHQLQNLYYALTGEELTINEI